MTQIKKIIDKQCNDIYLRTHTKAVVDDNGYTAESRLQAMQDQINQAQLAVGAVPSDLNPTEGSTNWVTSGGVYNQLFVSADSGESIDLLSYEPVAGAIYSTNKWWYSDSATPTNYGYCIFVPVEPRRDYIITGGTVTSSYAFMTDNTVGNSGSYVTTFASGYDAVKEIANTKERITAPDDARYLWLYHSYTTSEPNGNRLPSGLAKAGTISIKVATESLLERVNKLEPNISIMRAQTQIGYLATSTGLYPTQSTWYIGYSHTPKFIKNCGQFKILTTGVTGFILFYGNNQSYLGADLRQNFDTTNGAQTITPPDSAKFFRLAITGSIKYIDIESIWDSECEQFQARPSDGYQPFTFEVHPIRCNSREDNSSLRSQYYVTTDSGMLHLPSSYKETGQPTPLIIYLHGAANDYTSTSKSFPSAVPLAPEWDAAGFAQMDIDLIPDLYNNKQNNTAGGSSDDAECVMGAYKWCIEHFNIRRDGVYLIGRSRGGQAVLQTLGRYNPSEMPIIAAINNAGANALINYGIITSKSTAVAFWNLLCESFNLPTDGRPSANTSAILIKQNDVYNFLAANIDMWWKKASVGALLMTDNKSEYQTASEILQFLHEYGYSSSEYLGFLEQLRFRSPVPLRFDWCAADTIQKWNANDGRGNYSSIIKDGFVKNLSGNAEYREWPTVDTTIPSVSGASDRGHWHELYNYYNGDYTLPNGAVVTNPSMARVEWLLWCMSHDNRF